MTELPHERAVSPFPEPEFRRDAKFPVPVARRHSPVKFQATSSKPNILLACERILSKESNRDRAVSEVPHRPMENLAGKRSIRKSPKHAQALPQHGGHPRLRPFPAFAKRARRRNPAPRREVRASACATGRKRHSAPDRGRLATAALSKTGPLLPAAPGCPRTSEADAKRSEP